jgi:hypothetical protein
MVRSRTIERAAWTAALLLLLPLAVSVAAAQQADSTASPVRTEERAANQQQPAISIAEFPDSPGTILARAQSARSQQSDSQPLSGNSSSVQAQTNAQGEGQQHTDVQSQDPQGQQTPPQKPVGTAAAEPMHANGIAASQPSGVAVAPAKQRRSRTLVIKVAALVGAAVAVGTVVALTAGTSSRPPGAH